MILLDANLLVYASVSGLPQREAARRWLDCAPVWIPQPTERHRTILASLLTGAGERSNLVPDAHLAALAIEHGLKLCSTDGDFARFSGLQGENPLG